LSYEFIDELPLKGQIFLPALAVGAAICYTALAIKNRALASALTYLIKRAIK
jgi:hypothetical protein